MPALNFKKHFAKSVEDGVKTQTIRAARKHPIQTGDRLYLYTGMRTKNCRKLGEATAKIVREIQISDTSVKIDGQALYSGSVEKLAHADGFSSISEFKDFFRSNHGFPFCGQLIHWGEV